MRQARFQVPQSFIGSVPVPRVLPRVLYAE